MAIIIKTTNPQKLKDLIYKELDAGNLRTWKRRGKTEEITHYTSEGQWDDKAWLTPRIAAEDKLVFNINFPDNADLNQVRVIYGIYHGRFIERLVTNFYKELSNAYALSKPSDNDKMTEPIRKRLNN